MNPLDPPTAEESAVMAAYLERTRARTDQLRRRRRRGRQAGGAGLVAAAGLVVGLTLSRSGGHHTQVSVGTPPATVSALTTPVPTTVVMAAPTIPTGVSPPPTTPVSGPTTTYVSPTVPTVATTDPGGSGPVIITSPRQVSSLHLHVGEVVRFALPWPADRYRPDHTPVEWPQPSADGSSVLSQHGPLCPTGTTCATFEAVAPGTATITVTFPSGIVCNVTGQDCIGVAAPAPAEIAVTVTG